LLSVKVAYSSARPIDIIFEDFNNRHIHCENQIQLTECLAGHEFCKAKVFFSELDFLGKKLTKQEQLLGASTHRFTVTDLELIDSDHLLTYSDGDGSIKIWNKKTGVQVTSVTNNHFDKLTCFAAFAEKGLICTGGRDGRIIIWDIKKEESIHVFEHEHKHQRPITFLKFDNNGILYSTSEDCTMRTWNVIHPAIIKIYRGHTGTVTCLDINPDNGQIYTGSNDKTIVIWKNQHNETEEGLNYTVCKGHKLAIWALKYADGKLFSGSMDGTARIWNIESGECIRVLSENKADCHKRAISSIEIDSFGILVYTASWDQTIRIWNIENGELKYILNDYVSPDIGEFVNRFSTKGMVVKKKWIPLLRGLRKN